MSTDNSIHRQTFKDLLERKRAYERYFKEKDEPDNPANTAYLSILKALLDVAKKAGVEEDQEQMKHRIEEIFRTIYGIEH